MNKFNQTLKYILSDIVSATIAWSLFIYIRSTKVEKVEFVANSTFYTNLLLALAFWMLIYFFAGFYKDIYRRSRLNEFVKLFFICSFGVILLFFGAILDDIVISYKQYYFSFLTLFTLHFSFTAFLRLLITNHTAKLIHKKIIGFNTIIIGSGEKAIKLIEELKNEHRSSGHKIIGFLTINNNETARIEKETKNLGKLKTILKLISEHNIEDIIIATEENENHKIEEILTILEQTNVFVQVIPDISDILYGRVKMNSILATPLIKINNDIQPEWEKRIKLFLDYLFALICIILFSPIYLICGIIVKLSSKGPIIYKQKRIGINGKSFTIFKFRSMFIDSEKNGPQLSSKKDARITRFGKFMRKVRLDETPQFFNILKGDMSFVGPRPEREYFAKKLLEKSPYYSKIYKVKPGITSWGMVKYGYAENIEEMSERLKYDLLYLKNRSLLIDLKIMIHTIAIIFEGRGK